MVSRELLGLADLSGAQALCMHKMTEIIVFSKDKNLMLVALQVVVLSLECFNNSQKLIIVGLISYFRWNHFP